MFQFIFMVFVKNMRNRDELIRSFKDYSGQTVIMIVSGSLTDVPRLLADWLA